MLSSTFLSSNRNFVFLFSLSPLPWLDDAEASRRASASRRLSSGPLVGRATAHTRRVWPARSLGKRLFVFSSRRCVHVIVAARATWLLHLSSRVFISSFVSSLAKSATGVTIFLKIDSPQGHDRRPHVHVRAVNSLSTEKSSPRWPQKNVPKIHESLTNY